MTFLFSLQYFKSGGNLFMISAEKIVYTTQKDFPLSTIREMFDDGDIITNPDY